MSILVIGATGHTGAHVVKRLRELGVEALGATRTPTASGQVRFDWRDASTHEAALANVTGMYLIAPPEARDPAPPMTKLIELGLARGVRRFVLLSSSAVPADAPGLGAVERFLRERAPEWAVLKPSWFMQNFTDTAHVHARTIRDEGRIYTATGDGRVAFVDAADIAEVGARALSDDKAPNTALIITGPEALSYADVARMLTPHAEHVAISDDEARAHLVKAGIDEAYAAFLVHLDAMIRQGSEDRVTDTVERITGRPPKSLAAFLREHQRSAA